MKIFSKIALMLVLASSLFLPAAQGHSALVTSTPKNGAVVKTFPKTFKLTFNEEILKLPGKEPSRVQLIAPNRMRISLGKVAIVSEVLSVPMSKAAVKAGKYRLTYRVVSKDGHVINGAISFTYKP